MSRAAPLTDVRDVIGVVDTEQRDQHHDNAGHRYENEDDIHHRRSGPATAIGCRIGPWLQAESQHQPARDRRRREWHEREQPDSPEKLHDPDEQCAADDGLGEPGVRAAPVRKETPPYGRGADTHRAEHEDERGDADQVPAKAHDDGLSVGAFTTSEAVSASQSR